MAESDFLGSVKGARILGGFEKNRGIFGGCKKRTMGFFGVPVCLKSRDFWRWTNSEVVIFFGIKYEPLSDPPSLKFVSGAPKGTPI